MCRFILLDAHKEKGKWFVVLYDRAKNFLYVESLMKFRMKRGYYEKLGIKRKEP